MSQPFAKKRLGQHFLRNEHVAQRIAEHAHLTRADVVLEIGPGHGILTQQLAPRAGRVVALELDDDLARTLPDKVRFDNVEVIHGDAVDVDWPRFDACVSNLPYNVSTPILFRLLETRGWTRSVLMLQREFAERMRARPDTPEYGRLSVEVAYRARVEYLDTVPPGAFTPPPKVQSSVVRLTPHEAPPVRLADEALFHAIVKAAFTQRRKKLSNALANARHLLPGGASHLPAEIPHGARRPGELSLGEFAEVTAALAQRE